MPPLPATTMRAIEITTPGAPDVLRPTQRPVPAPAAGEVLIKVVAAGVNRPDVFQRKGAYAPPPGASDLPGLEVAGHVVALGAGVDAWKTGDAVCALVSGGGYAEYVCAPGVQCLPVPRGLSLTEAAGLPETFFTVWVNVFQRAGLKAGESLLVQGGSSGIGVTAIQLGRSTPIPPRSWRNAPPRAATRAAAPDRRQRPTTSSTTPAATTTDATMRRAPSGSFSTRVPMIAAKMTPVSRRAATPAIGARDSA